MEYLILNKINNNILINKRAFYDLIKVLPRKVEGIKIAKIYPINFVRNNKNVELAFEFTLALGFKIEKKMAEMKSILENSVIRLIDRKPYNINMVFIGRN